VVSGRFLRIASIHDADFLEDGLDLDPAAVLRQFAVSGLKADLFTFSGSLCDPQAKHPYKYDWDNAAAACSTNYDAWWNSLPQESRKNVRRSVKRGVSVRTATLDADLVRGIKRVYDETPMRQGRRFWHYGKDVERIRAENSSYLDRSEFIGAWHEDELIGFMKIVFVGHVARIMQILAMSAHQDKRPMNAMLARAMEVCHQRGATYLVYSKFTFGKKKNDDMAEFKRRNGFVQIDFPRYFVPLTLRGRLAYALKLHRGLIDLLPAGALQMLAKVRTSVLGAVMQRPGTRGAPISTSGATVESLD
jgi:hypothetical protein